VLVQLARNGLVLTDDLVSDSVVNAVEEVKEPAGDTLLFCLSARYELKIAYGQSRWPAEQCGHRERNRAQDTRRRWRPGISYCRLYREKAYSRLVLLR
jgi:hypothetical protein